MATIVLKSTSGKEFEIPSNELKQLQKEAIQAYNDSIELDKLTAGKSELKKWQIEMQLQKAGKLKFGSIFQVTKKQLVVSYKRNLINGLFEGHEYDCCSSTCGRSVKLIDIDGMLYAKVDESYNY